MTINHRVRIAPGADRTGSAFSWDWDDRTADTRNKLVQVVVGRSDQSGSLSPRRLQGLVLDNPDGRYTLGHPNQIDGFGQGCPITYEVQAGDPYLWCTGNTNSGIMTPDGPSIRPFGDQWAGIEVEAPTTLPPSDVFAYGIYGRSDPVAGQLSWLMLLLDTGHPWLVWSTDGTVGTQHDAVCTVPLPRPAAGPFAWAWDLDVDNGAGGHTVTYYAHRGTLEDLRLAVIAGDTSVQLGDPIVGVGTTSVHAGTADLFLGGFVDSAGPEYPGRIRAAELRLSGPSGDVLAHPVITDQVDGATSWVDDANVPLTWTVSGDAYVTSYRSRFVGEIRRAGPRNAGGGAASAECVVEAASVFARDTQREKDVRSVLTAVETTQGDDLIAGWTMEDERGATKFAPMIPGGHHIGFGPAGVIQLADDDSLPASKPLPHLAPGDGWLYQGTVPARPGITDYRGTIFLDVPTLLTTGPQELFTLRTTGTVASWTFFLDDNQLIFQGFNNVRTLLVNPGAAVASDWNLGPVQLTLGIEQDGANIDWAVAWLTLGGTVFGSAGTVAGTIGYPTAVAGAIVGPDTDGLTLGHITVTTGLAAGWLGWTDGANNAYQGEEDHERISRVVDERGLMVATHTTNQADILNAMGPQRPRKFVDVIDDTAAAGLGILGDHSVEFGYHYRTRASLYGQTPRITVDSATVHPFEPDDDDRAVITEATVNRTEGGTATYAADDAIINQRGLFDTTRTLNVDDENGLDEIASWIVHEGTWDELRLRAWTLQLTKPAAVAAGLPEAWLGMAIGDMIAMDAPVWLPPGDIRQLLLGYTETIQAGTPGLWQVAINGIPAGPYDVGLTDEARADTDGSELNAAIDDNDTSWSVATPDADHAVWIDTAGFASEFPFYAKVGHRADGTGGEVVEVTAITGTTSPQTFTVVRAQEGTTARAHPDGAPVALAYPTRAAL